ncbi:MAG: Protein export cytoplasm protein SecA ATPase helicase [Actinomycetia bacterium]|nr:Protein export cytoplasm protein SecA ATPase helicase [Actinomycetes bacterium]
MSIVRRLLQKPGTIELTPFLKLLPQVDAHEQRLRGLTDGELTAAAQAAHDDAEICACCREAAWRALGERPYDVQVLGTLAMLSGLVAEMATGEGKTLSGALAAAGHALRGRSVHVMSVNDYLARRDAEWMRPVYDLLGVTVGWLGQASTVAERRRAYAAQVTYAPVSEFGFDVLRDRLVTDIADLVAGDPDVVLIDEADSVLIDEARVPLVLAGAAETADADREMARIAAGLRPGRHYEIDEDGRNVSLSSAGASAAERALGGIDLYTAEHAEELTRLNVALHAHALLQRDVDYIVRDGAVHLINESRGRVARRQRWPDGLHAAVEAKEGLAASESGEILDTVTIQSLVRRYRTICGMTGTAVAAGEQFREFYGLEIAVIPPNRPCIRTDEPDRLYPTVKDKEKAVVGQVAAAHATGRPVLIGTLDVAESEQLAGELGRAGLRCTVLNAKNDAQEAAIVAEAGAYGAITVSTQMAGRGTDIRLGGIGGDRNLIAKLGGLYIIGTGRRASSRLDHQLRGRAGRQGDPGGSVFFASMEDELILQYAPDEARAQVPDSTSHWALGHAQRVAEGVNLEIHRNTWQYNKLVEDQRRIVLGHRDRVLRADDALSALARRCPERLAELSPDVDRSVLVSAARQIVLFHLDRAWAEHLTFLADLREGIHLRALARGTVPLNEFNKEAIRAFGPLLEEAAAQSAATFRTAAITAGGVDLEAAGLKRPTATWTYLVHENPFGTDIDRALRSIARRIRKLADLCRTEVVRRATAGLADESHCRWHHARMMRLPHVLVGFTRMKCAGTPAIHGSSPAPMIGARSASVSR